MTKERALELINRAKALALVILILSALGLVLHTYSLVTAEGQIGDAALILGTNVAFMFIVWIGFRQKSRLIASLLLLSYLLTPLAIEDPFEAATWNAGPATVLIAGIVIWIVFTFFRGTQGTYAYHRRMKEEDPSHKPTRAWHVGLVTVTSLIIFGIGGIELSERFGLTNASRVIAGEKLAAADLAELQEYDIIRSTDTVKLIYAPTLFSISAEGMLVTEDNFIAYEAGGPFDSVYIYEIPLRDIRQVDVLTQGGEFTDTIVEITFTDDSYVEITLPITDGGDAAFIKVLRSQIGADNEAAS